MNKRTITTLILIILVCISIAAYQIYNIMYAPNFHTHAGNGTTYIHIRPHTDINKLITDLTNQNIVLNPDYLKLTAKVLKTDKYIKAGRYKINDKDNSWVVMQRIRKGEQTPVKLTINNIRTPEQFAAKISKQLMTDSTSIMQYITDSTKMDKLGFKPNQLFVLVISNTYEVWWTISVDALMKRLKNEHDRFWARNERTKQASIIGLTPAEVTTLASIIDEETYTPSERRRIAGLYLNRLHCGMLLQSDPTVKYALADFSLTQILYSHLSIDSPYNTYRYAGLPPGPIRMPNPSTIDAVLNAEQHNYLYMCADPAMNGTHRFAKTLSEHNSNAHKYHAALRRWKAQQK